MYLNLFGDREDVEREFQVTLSPDINILLAWYRDEFYEGSAFVLFEQDGKLYEVNGSHCSCFGLEGQWNPDETSIKALAYRLTEGKLGLDYDNNNTFAATLRQVLFHRFGPQSGEIRPS